MSSATCPSSNIIILSANKISSVLFVIYIIVYPLCFNDCIILYTVSLPSESIIVVGSSNIIYFGFTAKTPAIATLCFCPNDSSAISPIFSFFKCTFSNA